MSKFDDIAVIANFSGIGYPIDSFYELLEYIDIIEKLEVANNQLINENKPFNNYNLSIAIQGHFTIKCDSKDNFILYYPDKSKYYYNKKELIGIITELTEA